MVGRLGGVEAGGYFACVKFNRFIKLSSIDVEEARHPVEKAGLEICYWESLVSIYYFNPKYL